MIRTGETREVLAFEGFTLDRRRGCLLGPSGAEVALAPKPFDLLCFLADRAGRTLTKNELLEAVWPGLHVTDDSLFQAVRDVRRAIGDEVGRVLRTIPRRGYLLDATVTSSEGAPAEAAVLVPPEDRPSLVVLPFANISGDTAQDYFADGMSEEITAALVHIRTFFVIARNSAFTYKGRAVDVRQVGRELGVRYVVEGSVRKAGQRVRITAQLVEAETGRHLWAERFDAALGDVFDLQDRVAEAIAGAIEPNLQAAEVRRSVAKPTSSLAAYDLYLRALPHHYSNIRAGNDAALELLYRACNLDKEFSLAKALGAFCHVLRSTQGWSSKDDKAQGILMARDALSGAGHDPATLRLAGHAIAYLANDHDAGLTATSHALALNPYSAQVAGSAAYVHLYAFQADDAIPLFERAMRLSPRDPEMPYMMSGIGLSHLIAAQFEAAAHWGEQAVRGAPGWAPGHRVLISALWELGRQDEARNAAAEMLRHLPSTNVRLAGVGWKNEVVLARYRETLRNAGVPP